MILLEHYIELKIYHLNSLQQYDVIQTLRQNAQISFKVLQKGEYIFTLVVKDEGKIAFELSQLDKELDVEVDWKLFSKIEACLFSIFLKQIPS
jgi:hypothetical protein